MPKLSPKESQGVAEKDHNFFAIQGLLLTIGTLAIMGCGADSVQYPGAPAISIKKMGWTREDVETYDAAGIRKGSITIQLLRCRLEAEEPLPYDIDVTIEFTNKGEREDGSIDEDSGQSTMRMQAGRAVLGFNASSFLENFYNSLTLSISIIPWDGLGDAPYNVGNSHTLHESWRKLK